MVEVISFCVFHGWIMAIKVRCLPFIIYLYIIFKNPFKTHVQLLRGNSWLSVRSRITVSLFTALHIPLCWTHKSVQSKHLWFGFLPSLLPLTQNTSSWWPRSWSLTQRLDTTPLKYCKSKWGTFALSCPTTGDACSAVAGCETSPTDSLWSTFQSC